ncbi:hypothetical protein ACL7TT_02705 [Microbulbifer sp. 2304DJ12-6]|uniref:hypothetical protein n=1 Tax=Microbulbifer sp. 2304DJ12-6 TaxID=3233340 RepID=UPI0039B120FC
MRQIFNCFWGNGVDIVAKKLLDNRLFDPEYMERVSVSSDDKKEKVTCEEYCSRRELWRVTTSGLFCGRYYLNRYHDIINFSDSPATHYLKYGFHEGRSPSPLIDIKFICEQYRAKISQGIGRRNDLISDQEILSQYPSLYELLRELDISPNPIFDNNFFRGRYDCQDDLPILVYLRLRSGYSSSFSCLETTPLFSMEKYMKTFPDLVEAKVDPLCHLLEWGITEGRLESAGLISKFFKESTLAMLPGESDFSTYNFLSYCSLNKTLASSHSASKYTNSSLPYFLTPLSNSSCNCFIGVVLYKNSEDEILRFKAAMDKEVGRNPGSDIVVKYYINDRENVEIYKKILNAESLIFSSEGNVGFGRGHNALMELCFPSYDIYVGLNPDGYVLPGFIRSLLNFDSYNGGHALIEAVTAPIDHPKWHDPITMDTYWVSGAAFAISKLIWNEVGGFDPNIHMYCEDVDLSWRVKAAGFDLKVCPKARFFHDVTPRFISENIKGEKDRTIRMLTGAYYLALKWRGETQAEALSQQLKELGVSEDDEIFSTDFSQVSDDCPAVSNFDNWLRYSPSRFW